jgi:transposase-like protein
MLERYARPVGGSWRCDETYIKVNGRWTYLYRAVDKVERTVDFYLSERRDVNAAKHFFRKAMKSVGPTSDHSRRLRRFTSCSRELESDGQLPRRVRVRSSKYLNNNDRARSSAHQVTDRTDARIQTV